MAVEELGIRLRADGVVEATNGVALTGRAVDELGKKLDAAGKQSQTLDTATRSAGAGAQALGGAARVLANELSNVLPFPGAVNNALQGMATQGGTALAGLSASAAAVAVSLGALAVGGTLLTVAYLQGAEESRGYARALILTGNAAGTNTQALTDMAASIATTVGTQRNAAQALAQMAASGAVAAGNLQSFTTVAIEMERTLGVAVSRTVEQFKTLADDPLKASLRLNEGTNYLTTSIYEQIRALEQQGDAARAGALAQTAYAEAMAERTAAVKATLNELGKAWQDAKDEAGRAWDIFAGIGREATVNERLKEIRRNLDDLRKSGQQDFVFKLFGSADDLRSEEAMLNRTLLRQQEAGAAARSQALLMEDYRKAREANQQWTDSALSNTERMNAALEVYRRNLNTLRSGGLQVDDAQVAKEEAAIRKKFADKPQRDAKPQADAYKSINDQITQRLVLVSAELSAGEKLSASEQARLTLLSQIEAIRSKEGPAAAEMARGRAEALARLIALEEKQRAHEKESAEARKRFATEQRAQVQETLRETEQLQRQRDQAGSEIQEIGLTSRALFELRQARIDETIAAKQQRLERMQGADANSEEAAGLEKQIELLKEMKVLQAKKVDADTRAADDAENKRRTDGIAQSITDGFFQGKRGAATVMENFRRELQNAFARTVLQPRIQALADSGNDLLGSLIKGAVGLFTGMSVDTSGAGQGGGILGDGSAVLPGSLRGGGATGTNELERDMITLVHKGEAIIPKAYNPDAGGRGGRGGGGNVTFAPNIHIDSRTDKAEIMRMVQGAMTQANAQLLDMMERRQA